MRTLVVAAMIALTACGHTAVVTRQHTHEELDVTHFSPEDLRRDGIDDSVPPSTDRNVAVTLTDGRVQWYRRARPLMRYETLVIEQLADGSIAATYPFADVADVRVEVWRSVSETSEVSEPEVHFDGGPVLTTLAILIVGGAVIFVGCRALQQCD